MRRKLLVLFFWGITLIGCTTKKKAAPEIETLDVDSKEVQEIEEVHEKEEYELPVDYQDTRRIKYLSKDSYAVVAFFDNGRATLIRDFELCEENMYELYEAPSEYTYELVGNIVSFTRKEDDFATGIRLSSNFWVIKDFNEIVEIQPCN
ncbi:hypothetical protein [Sediminicola luteus]|uniref:Lipoprotein n=1 Tax=Sediminicola luteus TaxID=319238 RepID=A0A2A4G807_9FLAO|nr:hypothetical protein [Sediminicola luteus]PCE64561.1 hypothetical protein B7P33_09780 [Sediminicola luteus]